jgi:hypothetical protein
VGRKPHLALVLDRAAAVHSGLNSGKRAIDDNGTHRQHGLAGRQCDSDDLATSCYELDDDDLRGTERVRAAAADFGEERGAAVLTRGDGGGVWTARRRCGARIAGWWLRTSPAQNELWTTRWLYGTARWQCHPEHPIRARVASGKPSLGALETN